MSKHRILIVTQCFPPIYGGIENLLFHLAKQLHTDGHSVEVHADGKLCRDTMAFDQSQDFPVYRYAGIKPVRCLFKSSRLNGTLKSQSFDTIITDSWKSLEYLPKTEGINILCLVHGSEINNDKPKKRRRISRSFQRADHLICNSRFTADMARAFTDDCRKIHVIHPGIPAFPESLEAIDCPYGIKLKSSSPRLISIGRLEKRKGIDRVLACLPHLVESFPELVYMIAGSGSESEALQSMVEASDLKEHVIFSGNISEQEKQHYLKLSDLFILTGNQINNDIEGFGISIIEAASFQVPALVSRTGGVSEAVIDGETGIVCENNKPETLCHHIHQLLNNPDRLKQLGSNAKKRADDLQWSKAIKQYEAFM